MVLCNKCHGSYTSCCFVMEQRLIAFSINYGQSLTLGIRAGMAPGSTSQRVDQLEEKMGEVSSKVDELTSSLPELVARAVEKGLEEWRRSFEEKIAERQEATSHQLEGKIDQQFETLKKDQEEIRAEIRTLRERVRGYEDENQYSLGLRTRNGDDSGIEGRGNRWFRKMEIPIFAGLDPDGWVVRVEQYFEFQRLMESEKLQAAVVSMEGEAPRWYWWENRRRPVVSWADLKARALVQFRPANEGSLHEQWLAVRHTTMVTEYRRLFIDKAAPLDDVSESVMKGQFINCLEEKIKSEVRMLNHRSLEQAMDLALRIEEKNRVTKAQEVSPTDSASFSYSPTTFSYFDSQLSHSTNFSMMAQPHFLTTAQPNPN